MAFILLTLFSSVVIAETTLSTDSPLSTAGYFRLSWESPTAGSYEVEQSREASFTDTKLIYTGNDTASVLSGLANGEYFYRARLINEPWSDVLHVKVQHHTMNKAWMFFSVGVLMFLVLISILIFAPPVEEEL